MKNWIKIGSLAIMLMGIATAVQAQKFGYVNSSAILAELPEVKQAESNLEALQGQLQKKGESMVKALQDDFMELQKQVQAGTLAPKQQSEREKKLQEEEQKIAKFEQDMRKQIQEKRDELLSPIYEKVNQAIQDVAKENGYQFIFDQGVLLYAEDSQDVSELVKAKLSVN
ncbi:MAG TPA: OmpH family outer membrane protein [Phaeodactylibacter sp.]|nr:OmpH family outer membrane protein [Phaeodactylibacter sp.]